MKDIKETVTDEEKAYELLDTYEFIADKIKEGKGDYAVKKLKERVVKSKKRQSIYKDIIQEKIWVSKANTRKIILESELAKYKNEGWSVAKK